MNVLAAFAIAIVQEHYAYWPHDSIGYILTGLAVFEDDGYFVLSRANFWSIIAGLFVKQNLFLVRLLGLFLFFMSVYVLYLIISDVNESLARVFVV
ncbi:MAG TPA: hypothetical protein EYH23_00585, partial [Euryarchaeota archaeon]|nr:hypothetical protein [Euryarchaeota archaeon]